MKICLVSVEYPPHYGGGISTYTDSVSRFLARAGHEVHVITNAWVDYVDGDKCEMEHATLPTLHVHRIDAFCKDVSLRPAYQSSLIGSVCHEWGVAMFWSILVADKLEEIHRQFRIDIVEFPESSGPGYVSLRRRAAGLGPDIPITVTLHTPTFIVNQYNFLSRQRREYQRLTALEEYCIRHADSLNSPSHSLAERVPAELCLDVQTQFCSVIRYPVELDAEGAAGQTESEHASLLFVGRLEPRKGIIELVDSLVRLMANYPSLKLHLIGLDCHAGAEEDSMSAYLRRRIPSSLEHRFVFEGLLPRTEVLKRYASATACVFPAPWDNFPYACCEAMSRGACVVASEEGGMGELIEPDRSGILFKPAVSASLDAAIRRALDGGNANELRLGAARRIREVCDPAAVIPQRLSHYQRTIDHRRCGAGVERRERMPAGSVRETTPTLCVFLPSGGRAAEQTAASVLGAADHAGLKADVHLARDEPSSNGIGSTGASAEHETRRLSAWLQTVAEKKPTYICTLLPGDKLDAEYFKTTLAMLNDDPRAAWATTWARYDSRPDEHSFSGMDFAAPLELMNYCPIPFAVIRRSAFDEVGGWNLSLPREWRAWDLWLAFAQAQWRGLVAPVWQAAYCRIPNGLQAPHHAMSHEIILEKVVARNRKLFSEHGGALWAFMQLDQAQNARGPLGVFGPDGALRALMKNARKGVARRIQRIRPGGE